jgi:hypothetical protein
MTALAGIRVLDVSRVLAGPSCAQMFADMGADVIKVERPDGGDDARRMPPFIEGRSQPFAVWNRNKRSITADLKNADDVALVKRLAARAERGLPDAVALARARGRRGPGPAARERARRAAGGGVDGEARLIPRRRDDRGVLQAARRGAAIV